MKWKHALSLSSCGLFEKAQPLYDAAERVLGNDRYFLYNYAAELNVARFYKESLDIAMKCRHLWSDYDLEMLIAQNCWEINRMVEAEEYFMKTINLRWIYPHYRHDEFVEVSDEVWEVMRQAQREMNNYERRKVYHRAWYSLDAYSWTENYALEHSRSPEEILLEREERAAHLRLLAALPEALSHATPTQARRVRAYYIAGISQPEISRREGVDSSKVSVAIRRGLRNMRRCYDCLFPAE